MSYTNDFFIEEELDGCFFRLMDEQVNDFLRELELDVPPLDVCGKPGGGAVCPDVHISECERTEKERAIRLDAYSVAITFPVPEGECADLYCYAYAAAFDKALRLNPTLGDLANEAVLTGKKYIRPRKPGCGGEWNLVITVRVTVERIADDGE
ncbi:MAG: hypothetical protein LBP20_05950 [Treponema sp.]|jgi:hypothetical protein|nr:hypothetical protein [Treponema sp.]